MLPGANAARYGHVELAFAHRHTPLRVDFGDLQCDGADCADVGILQIDQHSGVMVFAFGMGLRAVPTPRAKTSPVQRFKKVAELRRVAAGEASAGKFKAGIPVGGRTEILARFPISAQLVVGCALFGILEYFIRFADFLEACLGIGFLAHIRVIFACQQTIGALDLFLGGVSRNPHDLVIVLVFHGYIVPARIRR